MKKNKVLLKVIVVIVVVLILLVAAVQIFGGAAVKVGVEKAGSKAMQVPVEVDDISFSLLGGTVNIRNLIVGNPADYKIKNLLEVGNLYVDADIKSFLSDTVRIKHIKLDNMTMSIEQKGLTNNLKEVLDNLPKPEETGTETKTPPAEKGESKEKNLRIDTLEITGVKVKVKLIPLPGEGENAVELTLAPIKMTDLGTDDNLSIATLTGKILMAVAQGVAESGAGLLPEGLVGDITGALGEHGAAALEKSKEVLEKSKNLGEGIIKDGGDMLKGLFKKKDE
jgi:hypothetical protein